MTETEFGVMWSKSQEMLVALAAGKSQGNRFSLKASARHGVKSC